MYIYSKPMIYHSQQSTTWLIWVEKVLLCQIVPKNSEFPSLSQCSLTVKIHKPIYSYGLHLVEEQHKCHFTGPRHTKKNQKLHKLFFQFLNVYCVSISSNIFSLLHFIFYKNGWRTNVLFICLQNKRYTHINVFDSQRRYTYKTGNCSCAPYLN